MILRHAAPALLGLSLITGPAQALDLSAMSDAEREQFGVQVREYLLENPKSSSKRSTSLNSAMPQPRPLRTKTWSQTTWKS